MQDFKSFYVETLKKVESEENKEDAEKKGIIDKVADKISDTLDIGKEWRDGTVIKSKPTIGIARRGAKIINRVGAETLKSGINIAKAAAKGATEGGPYKKEGRESLKKRLANLEKEAKDAPKKK